ALDDVGAGNAGLETLRKVAIDWIKIDRSIVAAAPTDAVARGMLYALMAFADEAAATVIVEGIEIAEELELVLSPPSRPLGAYAGVAVQGFLLGEPSDATDFAYPSAFYVQAA
ncbi:MAG: EAL domain-containing protein, partial [Dehalococcoidia bacterium]|nr:EAL domain-containing protein [Dehalococcoidia bacterium]